jgi:hypothetical protein
VFLLNGASNFDGFSEAFQEWLCPSIALASCFSLVTRLAKLILRNRSSRNQHFSGAPPFPIGRVGDSPCAAGHSVPVFGRGCPSASARVWDPPNRNRDCGQQPSIPASPFACSRDRHVWVPPGARGGARRTETAPFTCTAGTVSRFRRLPSRGRPISPGGRAVVSDPQHRATRGDSPTSPLIAEFRLPRLLPHARAPARRAARVKRARGAGSARERHAAHRNCAGRRRRPASWDGSSRNRDVGPCARWDRTSVNAPRQARDGESPARNRVSDYQEGLGA